MKPSSSFVVRHAGRWTAATLVLALLAAGTVPRWQARARAQQLAAGNAVPEVRVVHPGVARSDATITLPGTLAAWTDASLRARSSGYVTQWTADIGSHVRAGQTLATIVAPELDAALRQARGDQATAQANFDIARSSAQRWQTMLQAKATSSQEAEQRVADLDARRAQLDAAKANVARLAQAVAYTRIVAPFDGVVTARNVDVGTLVDAASPAELFHEMQSARLRALVSVPDSEVAAVRAGIHVRIACGARAVDGVIARTAGALDPSSRMLRVEVDVPNADGTLLPGQYVQVTFAPDTQVAGSSLPVETVLYRPEGPRVAIVGADGRVELRPVSVIRDLGTTLVVAPTLAPETRIVANPADSIVDGQEVRTVTAQQVSRTS
jgi:membrane fusion protein, multidrug efflux system